ncbi:hypothetical protein I308_101716 [Cryptococcus tetragattii IND107]|uniref:Uncharacterized protein n=1 Tax=Cryptococcus tetragattii IND107 TaxID=1296105 RepID=A0ABR3BVB2_9TREE
MSTPIAHSEVTNHFRCPVLNPSRGFDAEAKGKTQGCTVLPMVYFGSHIQGEIGEQWAHRTCFIYAMLSEGLALSF